MPLAKKLSRRGTFQNAQNGAELLYHHAKFGGAGTSHAARGAKSSRFFWFVCLSFCPSRVWVRVSECHITIKKLELRNKSGTVG